MPVVKSKHSASLIFCHFHRKSNLTNLKEVQKN